MVVVLLGIVSLFFPLNLLQWLKCHGKWICFWTVGGSRTPTDSQNKQKTVYELNTERPDTHTPTLKFYSWEAAERKQAKPLLSRTGRRDTGQSTNMSLNSINIAFWFSQIEVNLENNWVAPHQELYRHKELSCMYYNLIFLSHCIFYS